MDNLTHSLAGAVLGQMGLKRKTGLGMPAVIIGANIPDIDALAALLGGHQHLAIRRGMTHGPIAMLVLPLILWVALLWYDKWQTQRGKRPEKRLPIHRNWLLALCFIGTLSHPALDWLNSYGVRLLEPFSSQWFYGDSIFIIDIWIWAALIISVWMSLRREKRDASDWQRPAWIGFAAICAYVFANGLITGTAESQTLAKLRTRHDPTASMHDPVVVANPVPVQFWRRDMIWRDALDYGSGQYSLGQGAVLNREIRQHNMGPENAPDRQFPIRVVAEPGSDMAAYLFWSRMPIVEIKGQEIIVRDQRFDNPLLGDRFSVRQKVGPQLRTQ